MNGISSLTTFNKCKLLCLYFYAGMMIYTLKTIYCELCQLFSKVLQFVRQNFVFVGDLRDFLPT
jgi:hypothetical protein